MTRDEGDPQVPAWVNWLIFGTIGLPILLVVLVKVLQAESLASLEDRIDTYSFAVLLGIVPFLVFVDNGDRKARLRRVLGLKRSDLLFFVGASLALALTSLEEGAGYLANTWTVLSDTALTMAAIFAVCFVWQRAKPRLGRLWSRLRNR